MKTLKEQFEQYRVPVDEKGWEAIAGDPAVKTYNRGRRLRRAAIYSATALVAAAAVITAVVLTRPQEQPTPAPETETAQVIIPDAPTPTVPEAPAAVPAPETTVTREVRSPEAQAPALLDETVAPPAAKPVPAVSPKSAPAPVLTAQPTPTQPTPPTLPELATPSAETPIPNIPAATRTEPDTLHPQQPQIADKNFFAPNAFSPNGDGINDIFYVYANTEYTDFELNIFSRNGDHVFQSRSIENGWDGRRRNLGEILPQGVYVYTIKYRTADQKSGVEKGQILLIK